ncbi:MAG: MBL fold metallo-hydrolase [Alphaproteobacteria bacterium]|nr:MBL fold metallo-hydrolase [Alphaproteobacteria bacterium]MBV9376958.1 MBL fold metallo-hydrolase [Alphaproteobacteria bacterium]
MREFGGTRYNGNSIFVFDTADLCIAHLSHLHHTLTPIWVRSTSSWCRSTVCGPSIKMR